jgi:hypothetical protein
MFVQRFFVCGFEIPENYEEHNGLVCGPLRSACITFPESEAFLSTVVHTAPMRHFGRHGWKKCEVMGA